MEAATAGPPERTGPATGIGGVPLDDPQRHRAYIAAAQRDLNRHLARLGSPVQLAVDGVWDEHCERAFVQVCRVLGLAPVRNVRTFRLIAGAAASRSDAERALARSDGAAYERELREHYAKERRATTVGAASLSEQERSRAYVATLQRDLNAHLQHLGVASSIDVDGEWDQDTARAFRQVCRVLGLTPERSVRTFRLISGAAASATKAERARASSQGSAYAERLREESPGVRPVSWATAHCRGRSAGGRTSPPSSGTSTATWSFSAPQPCSASTAFGASTPCASSAASAACSASSLSARCGPSA